MKTCDKCNKKWPDEYNVCPSCGSLLQKEIVMPESKFLIHMRDTNRMTVKLGNVVFDMIKVDVETSGPVKTEAGMILNPPSKSFFIGETPVTQALWFEIEKKNPSHFKDKNRPVECVNWYDCQEFLRTLSNATGLDFALPTIDQWRFAAIGGIKRRNYLYSGGNNVENVAWHIGNSGNSTHAVKQKMANELGIYDMSGNVYEWCADGLEIFDGYNISSNVVENKNENRRLACGGSWRTDFSSCQIFTGGVFFADSHFDSVGLRIVLNSYQ